MESELEMDRREFGLLSLGTAAAALVRSLRALVREAEGRGVGRDVAVAGLRLSAPALWHDLPDEARERLLRHGRRVWDRILGGGTDGPATRRGAPRRSALLRDLVVRGLLLPRAGRRNYGYLTAPQPGLDELRALLVGRTVSSRASAAPHTTATIANATQSRRAGFDGAAEIWPAPPRAVIASPISSARRSATVMAAASRSISSAAHRFPRPRRWASTSGGRNRRAA